VTGLKRLIGPLSGYLDSNLFQNLTTLNVKNAKYFYYFLHDCTYVNRKKNVVCLSLHIYKINMTSCQAFNCTNENGK
jgi:hypothetical protein